MTPTRGVELVQGIEHQNDRGIGLRSGDRKTIVQVSSLGVLVVTPRDIARACFRAVFAKPSPPCIIQNPDGGIWIIQCQSRQNRPFQDFEWLVICANENIDGREIAFALHSLLRIVSLPRPIDITEKDDNRHQRVDDRECFESKEEILP